MRIWLTCLTLLMGLWTLTGFFGSAFWVCDLVNHFTAQAAWLLAAITLLLVLKRHWRWAIGAGLLLMIHLSHVIPLYLPPSLPNESGHSVATIRLVQYNVHYKTKDQKPLADFLARTQPDIIALEEFTEPNRTALETYTLMKHYPYRTGDHRETALYSRFPLTPVKQHLYKTIAVDTRIHGQPVRIVVTHPPVPVFWHADQQKQLFEQLSTQLTKSPSTVLLLGDLNTTPWSPNFQHLLQGARLRNSMQGFGTQPSWPSMVGGPYIPIDHCLYRGNLVITHREVGPALGSDHLPVVLDIDLYSNDPGE